VLRMAEFDGRFMVLLSGNADTIVVQLLDASGHAPRGASIDLRTVLPNGDGIDVVPRRCGDGCVTGDYPWEAGVTGVLVTTTAAGHGTAVAFSVHWPPSPVGAERARAALARLAEGPVTYTETHTTAGGTTPEVTRTEAGAALISRSGLSAATALPYVSESTALLLVSGDGLTYYELDVGPDGAVEHELEYTTDGRVERAMKGTSPGG
jgi:hypothetical protein